MEPLPTKKLAWSERLGRSSRSFLLTADRRFLTELQTARKAFDHTVERVAQDVVSVEPRGLLDIIAHTEREHEAAVDRAIETRIAGGTAEQASVTLEEIVQPLRDRLDWSLAALSNHERKQFQQTRSDAQLRATIASQILAAIAVISLLTAVWLLLVLTRTLGQLRKNRMDLDATLLRLEGANRDLDSFAGRVAHDLRNVLTPLGLISGQLRHSTVDQDVRVGERLARVAKRASGLIDGLLAFARASTLPGAPSGHASVRETVRDVLEALAPHREVVQAEVDCIVDDVQVACPPSWLHVVLMNLVGNAIKFLAGRETRHIHITARVAGALCELTIEDTGPGIPFDAQDKIFLPFYRVPGVASPGMGIGLATVHRIVEACCGRIEVRSTPGEGTTFRVHLPL